jgi:pheromone shutdown-related protein TraB
MITLIGTGHVFNLSNALLSIFDTVAPDIVCVELDQQRYQAMILRQTQPETYEKARQNLPFVYRLLAQFQEDMAKQYGVHAGDEMLTAITYAQSHALPVAFIDTDAQKLFTTMWRTMPMTEKFKLMLSGFAGFFVSRKRIEQELKQYQDNYTTYIEEIGKRYPTIKRVLIDERNEYMVSKLTELHAQYQRIVACIGDGHVPGISQMLQVRQIPVDIIRLNDLQARQPSETSTDGSGAQFSVNYESP